MHAREFREWRVAMGLTQLQAAEALGLSKSTIEIYESGRRRDNDQAVEIPRHVALACAALLGGHGEAGSTPKLLQTWHDAALAAYVTKAGWDALTADLVPRHFQFSYGIHHSENQALDPGRMIEILRETNEQVKDLVWTGWSMFYPFTRSEIAPHMAVDPDSGQGDDDFVECSLLAETQVGASDFWRVARNGLATLLRGYFEDSARLNAQVRGERMMFLSPNWLVRDVAEFVRHAFYLSQRFSDVNAVSFRCAWSGLGGRVIGDPRGMWIPGAYKFRPDDNNRISTGTWSQPDLRDKWPEIVSALVGPVMRAAGCADVVDADWVRGQAGRWQMQY